MRILVKVLLYAAAIALLGWLLPQVATSLNQATGASSTTDASRGYALFAAYLLIGTGLAVFVAWDVSRALGEWAGRLFVGGGRLPNITPVLWKSDRLLKEGEPLQAVDALRDHLKTRPGQWYVAVRIADIYQHALHDPLSAALEYEQLLQGRLPRRARAEIMLRLAACHLLLRHAERAAALLQAIIEQHPHTHAAETATRRLARMSQP